MNQYSMLLYWMERRLSQNDMNDILQSIIQVLLVVVFARSMVAPAEN